MPDAPQRVLVITAHPDDVDFGAGATVASLVQAGAQVTYAICTDGDAGGFDPTVPRDQIPGIRRREQQDAAAELGVTDVRFLGYRDGYLTASMEVRRDLSRVIRQVQPQLVITQSPERNWQRLPASHPDHLAAGEAAIIAVYPDARNPFAHPDLLDVEGLTDWVVPEVWVMGGPKRDHYLDVGAFAGRKIAALRRHESQTGHMSDLDDRIRTWMTATAEEAGLPAGTLAEGFLRVVVPN